MGTTMLEKINPSELKLCQYWDTFGNSETEASAYWIVKFHQERGKGWEPFTLAEIEDFYNEKRAEKGCHRESFRFNHLLPGEHHHLTALSFMGGAPEFRPNPGGVRSLGGTGRDEKFQVEDSFICALVVKGYVNK